QSLTLTAKTPRSVVGSPLLQARAHQGKLPRRRHISEYPPSLSHCHSSGLASCQAKARSFDLHSPPDRIDACSHRAGRACSYSGTRTREEHSTSRARRFCALMRSKVCDSIGEPHAALHGCDCRFAVDRLRLEEPAGAQVSDRRGAAFLVSSEEAKHAVRGRHQDGPTKMA